MELTFHPRTSVEQVEEGTTLAPKFDAAGVIPVVSTDSASGELLMHAYMESGSALVFRESSKTFDPQTVYGNAPNPTKL
jgi:phosphoribosyl-AMP cyclohydrolase